MFLTGEWGVLPTPTPSPHGLYQASPSQRQPPCPPTTTSGPNSKIASPLLGLIFFPIALISIRHGIDFMFGLFIPQISAPQGQGSYLLAPRTVLGRPTMLIKYL